MRVNQSVSDIRTLLTETTTNPPSPPVRINVNYKAYKMMKKCSNDSKQEQGLQTENESLIIGCIICVYFPIW